MIRKGFRYPTEAWEINTITIFVHLEVTPWVLIVNWMSDYVWHLYVIYIMLVSSVGWLVGPQQIWNLNNSANLGRIGKKEISTESGGHAGHDYDVCACARKHARMLACMHAIFWCA